jgi:pyruvate/2-oxoglutarate dehydrogenase complex dihydrolipoamide dehydrogenase (E3) component
VNAEEWVSPDDDDLRRAVAPEEWCNPAPAERYNLVVIGGGTAGLVAAAGAAGLGARVALVESRRLGGDCLNFGCVPSKGLLASAHFRAACRDGQTLGAKTAEPPIDFAVVMQRMRRLRAGISHLDSAARFRALGVDVFFGFGRFAGDDCVRVTDRRDAEITRGVQPSERPEVMLRFHRALIATGARPSIPEIPGLDRCDFLTNETVFSLQALPARLGVLGGGPIGAELAQAFARLGSQVSLLERGPRILPRDDADAVQLVAEQMRRDGVRMHTACNDFSVEPEVAGSATIVRWRESGTTYCEVVDRLLIAAGRAPNVRGIGLEQVGVAFDDRTGVTVDDQLRTTNPRIYAAGDVCSRWKFTHAADFQARTVLRNALFPAPLGIGRSRVSRLVIPWCTYTSPELAQVGLNARQAAERGIAIETFDVPFGQVDRAILEGQTVGFVRVHVARGTDRLVGATIVGERAGELIGQFSLAMTHGLGLRDLSTTVFPYPTVAEAVRKTGDAYQRTRLTPRARRWLARWWRWQVGSRSVAE